MEQLPRGAQFTRSKMLWEIALGIAGDPNIRYYDDRDVSIVIGNGSGEAFTPALTMAPGSPALAHAVARGDLDMAFVNPSGMLTQAYRGTGLYTSRCRCGSSRRTPPTTGLSRRCIHGWG